MKFPILILKELKIKKDPLSFISDAHDIEYNLFYYQDFEVEDYIGIESIDGYEVNVFDISKEGEVSIQKKLMDKDFLGNRYPGEIGYIYQEIIVSKDANRHNSVTCISDFENIDKEDIDLIKFIYSIESESSHLVKFNKPKINFVYSPNFKDFGKILSLINIFERDKNIDKIIN